MATDRRVDVVGEGIDVAIRVRDRLDTDTGLVVRSFGRSRFVPVATPGLLDRLGRPTVPAELARFPALSIYEHAGAQGWDLVDVEDNHVHVEMLPRVICGDFSLLLESARRGMGVAMLPEWVSAPLLGNGQLALALPGWSSPQGIMHFIYPSRRGLLPGVRALVEFLAEHLPIATREMHEVCDRQARPS